MAAEEEPQDRTARLLPTGVGPSVGRTSTYENAVERPRETGRATDSSVSVA